MFKIRNKNIRKAKTSGEQRFTVLWMSTYGHSRSLGFGARTLIAAVCLLVVCTGAASWFVATYIANSEELAELRYMKEVAESQRLRIQELEAEFEQFDERLKQAEIKEQQVREALEKEGVINQDMSNVAVVASLDRTSITLPSRSSRLLGSGRAVDMERAIVLLQASFRELDETLSELETSCGDLEDKAEETIAYLRAKPAGAPAKGPISSEFGYRIHPITRKKDFHGAIDIAAPYNSKICASADGTVTFAGYKSGYGYVVVIKHGYGFETTYAHCSRIVAKYGQKVSRGDVIAYVGQSGTATGPHLHYAIKLDGEYVDPREYLGE
jgi:murein DD-endopeptidase MepM/ murein hydrolase activator NlpD